MKKKKCCCCLLWVIMIVLTLVGFGGHAAHRHFAAKYLRTMDKTGALKMILPPEKHVKRLEDRKKFMEKYGMKDLAEKKDLKPEDRVFWQKMVRITKKMRCMDFKNMLAFVTISNRNKENPLSKELFSLADEKNKVGQFDFKDYFKKEIIGIKWPENKWKHGDNHHRWRRHHRGRGGCSMWRKYHHGRHLEACPRKAEQVNPLTGIPHKFDSKVHQLLDKQRNQHVEKFEVMLKKERWVTFATVFYFNHEHHHGIGLWIVFLVTFPVLLSCCMKKKRRKMKNVIDQVLEIENRDPELQGYRWTINKTLTTLTLSRDEDQPAPTYVPPPVQQNQLELQTQPVETHNVYPTLYTAANPFNTPPDSPQQQKIDYNPVATEDSAILSKHPTEYR